MKLMRWAVLCTLVIIHLLTSLIAMSEEQMESNGFHIVGRADTPNFNKIYKSQFKDGIGEEAIINDLSHLAKDSHVAQMVIGNYLYTLLPVKDELFAAKRKESFETSIKLGKLALQEWLIRAAKARGITKTDAEQKMWLDFISSIDVSTPNADIAKFLEENPQAKRKSPKEIIEDSKNYNEALKRIKKRKADIDEITKITRDFDDHLQFNIQPKENSQFSLLNSDFWKKYKDKIMRPDAHIIQFGFKIPHLTTSTKPGDSGSFWRNGFNKAKYGLSMLIKIFSRGSTNSLTFMARPWIQHIRNLNTNEVIVSTEDPDTWYWETSSQYWYTKDNKSSSADNLQPFKFRAGYGMLWSSELKVLNDIKGAFAGVSFDINLPNKAIAAKIPKLKNLPLSLNVKVGQILPFEMLTLKDIKRVFNHTYLIGSLQVGIPLTKRMRTKGNTGFILSLDSLMSETRIPIYPIETKPKKPGKPGINPVIISD